MDHLTEKIWVSALKTVLLQHNSSVSPMPHPPTHSFTHPLSVFELFKANSRFLYVQVLCFISTLTELEPNLADLIKKECFIASESNEPKPEST